MDSFFTGGEEFAAHASENTPATGTGYDVTSTRLGKHRRDEARRKTNCRLHDGTHFFNFFCMEVSFEMGISGQTGQSRYVRDFYPHNIKIPSLTVTGQCMDQKEYGNLCEFIRSSQRKGVETGGLTQIHIDKGGSNLAKHVKGAHKPIVAQGYIKEIPRKYKQGEQVPKFAFEFVIARMVRGIYHEALQGEDRAGKTYLQILAALLDEKPQAEPKKPSLYSKEVLQGVQDINLAVEEGIRKLAEF